jgi:hypothetical protein
MQNPGTRSALRLHCATACSHTRGHTGLGILFPLGYSAFLRGAAAERAVRVLRVPALWVTLWVSCWCAWLQCAWRRCLVYALCRGSCGMGHGAALCCQAGFSLWSVPLVPAISVLSSFLRFVASLCNCTGLGMWHQGRMSAAHVL